MQQALETGPGVVELYSGKAVYTEAGQPVFSILSRNGRQPDAFLKGDAYSAATAFIGGEFNVEGDLVRAIQWRLAQPHSAVRDSLLAFAAKFARLGLTVPSGSARNIRFHYDRSNRFYETFLDSRMIYSCGYFRSPADSLDEAQAAKLDHICRKLHFETHDRFLDIGCGWGGLLFHAADHYGAFATGCTLSRSQFDYVLQKSAARGDAPDRIRVVESDFQNMQGTFDKIASVGMFEHVGHRRLRVYFTHVAGLLSEHGLFLNHAIARPEMVGDGPETLFLQKYVFPGGDLLHISEVIRAAEQAGFETLDVENLRPHYALTCRAWVSRLQAAEEECLQVVTPEVYRTWLLYLAGCAVSFEGGNTDIYQALFAKRSANQRRPLTRDHIYA